MHNLECSPMRDYSKEYVGLDRPMINTPGSIPGSRSSFMGTNPCRQGEVTSNPPGKELDMPTNRNGDER